MITKPLLALTVALATHPIHLAAQEDLAVLGGRMQYTDAPNALYRHLAGMAFRDLKERTELVRQIGSAEEWRERREWIRETLREVVGPFPDRTPLNARVTGTLEGEGYRVEKLLYESAPGYVVTAAVFVPDDLSERAPAIVYCSGHSAEGFRSTTYQTAMINLAKKGFIVLAFDPPGQGERLQYYDRETASSRIGSPTREHSYPGAQIFMTGVSPAMYFIWDGIRAVDYLVTRPDVDPGRIGITGRSGGGTQSAYIAAFDDRIRAAAIEAYITSFRRLFESAGPQDAEQNFLNGIASGIDHADLIVARAPQPTLLITTTRDFFSIQGARETFQEVQPAFVALGGPRDLRMVEDDAPHASTKKNREAMYRFFQEALDAPGDGTEESVATFAVHALRVTETGQVATSLQTEDLFSLNARRALDLSQRLRDARPDPRHALHVVSAARALSGYQEPGEVERIVFVGRFPRDGYAVEQYIVRGGGEYPVPMLFMLPDGPGPHPALVYLHPEGKEADAQVGGIAESLVRRGFAVLAPDVLGMGEMGPGDFRGDAYDYAVGTGAYNIWFLGIQVGQSLVGLRAGDVVRTVKFLEQRPDIDARRISAVAYGTLTPVLLHAAAFDSSITRVALVEPLLSYESLVTHRYYRPELVHAVVPGALAEYDLPDLAASLAPRPLMLVDGMDHNGNVAETAHVERVYAVTRRAYGIDDSDSRFVVERGSPRASARRLLISWLDGN